MENSVAKPLSPFEIVCALDQVAGSNWDEVKGTAVLSCSPESVVQLFATDNVDVIRSFNPMYESGYDIERYLQTHAHTLAPSHLCVCVHADTPRQWSS